MKNQIIIRLTFFHLALLFSFGIDTASAQSSAGGCGTEELQDWQLPLEEDEHNYIFHPGVTTIPVVVHVIHLGEEIGVGSNISDSQIHEAIAGLNDRWRNRIGNGVDMQIEFCLAQRDPMGNPTSGINRVDGSHIPEYETLGIGGDGANQNTVLNLSSWPDWYCNIWVVHKIASGAGGYAHRYGMVVNDNSTRYSSALLTHEMGHFFGIDHTFAAYHTTDGCARNDSCFAYGDKICDTPPHKKSDCGSSSSCTTDGIWDNSRYNYMSYCYTTFATSNGRFTPGQKSRIFQVMFRHHHKIMSNSSACDAYSELPCSSEPSKFTYCGGASYFVATSAEYGRELWRTNGNSGATTLVKDIMPGAGNSNPSDLTVFNGILYFTADDGTHGRELWRSDGNDVGTYMVNDISTGSSSSTPSELTVAGGLLYFAASTSSHGNELYQSDGTSIGTLRVTDINPNTFSSSPKFLTNVNSVLYFSAFDNNEIELWKRVGISTPQRIDVNPNGPGQPEDLIHVNGILYFSAEKDGRGRQLFRYDGTSLSHDVIGFTGSADPRELTNVNGTLFFSGYKLGIGRELFRKSSPTTMPQAYNISGYSSDPTDLTCAGTTLYFVATGNSGGRELWKCTQGGSFSMVKDILPGSGSSGPSDLTDVNGILYFVADDGVNGPEIWKSNGTASGTQLVEAITAAGTRPSSLANNNGTLFFATDDGAAGIEFWRSRGTAASTYLVKDIWICCANSCDDSDLCTIDNCIDGICLHSPRICNDYYSCTIDACYADIGCLFAFLVPGCCISHDDCNDSNACTTDVCNAGTCTNATIPNCCTSNTDCNDSNDSNACTTDACVSGTCSNTLIQRRVTSFTLVNSAAETDIGPLVNGSVINLSSTPNINVRANLCTNSGTGSVEFRLSGTRVMVEGGAPYAIASDVSGNYNNWSITPGTYTIEAIPYSGSGATGTAGTPLSITITVTGSSACTTVRTVASFTLVNSDTDLDIGPLTNGSVINLSATPNVNVRANLCTNTGTGSVKFNLNGSHVRYENEAPYALAGGNPYDRWSVAPGTYAIQAIPYQGTNGSGTMGTGMTITVTVANSAAKMATEEITTVETLEREAAKSAQLSAYPNPFKDELTIQFSLPKSEKARVDIMNMEGRLIATLFNGKVNENEVNNVKFQSGSLPEGMYFCRMTSESGVMQNKKVMLVK